MFQTTRSSKALIRAMAAQVNLPQTRALTRPHMQQRCLSNFCRDDDEPKAALRIDVEPFPVPKVYKKPKSMWEIPKCCQVCDLRTEVFRHDIMCLKPTPKKYTRTWVECNEFEKMVYDCQGEIEPPEILPRGPNSCPPKKGNCARCDGDEGRLGLMKCRNRPPMVGPCIKIRSPCCKKVRDPPVCLKVVKHNTCCQKRCTLYPAYSECKRQRPPILPPTECVCSKIPSMCEVYEQFRRFAWK